MRAWGGDHHALATPRSHTSADIGS
jgi:hypothetical protein